MQRIDEIICDTGLAHESGTQVMSGLHEANTFMKGDEDDFGARFRVPQAFGHEKTTHIAEINVENDDVRLQRRDLRKRRRPGRESTDDYKVGLKHLHQGGKHFRTVVDAEDFPHFEPALSAETTLWPVHTHASCMTRYAVKELPHTSKTGGEMTKKR